MNGGYAMIDLTGLDLAEDSEQTLDGVYAKAVRAMSLNKPIVLNNLKSGTADCTPTYARAMLDDTSVILAFEATTVTITSADKATVASLIPAPEL